jgi:hypothetical protein
MYAITGIQQMEINTVFQLLSMKEQNAQTCYWRRFISLFLI